MRKNIEYKVSKFTDWSKMQVLTPQQVKKLICEKVERAKLLSVATSKRPNKSVE